MILQLKAQAGERGALELDKVGGEGEDTVLLVVISRSGSVHVQGENEGVPKSK